MKSSVELIQILNRILNVSTSEKVTLVKTLQNEIWNDESLQDKALNEILSELAYDLDFYEPNEIWKKESPNYYGDERLDEIIKSGIQRIEQEMLKKKL
jgi:hypothetical protein